MAQRVFRGGHDWVFLQYLLGFRRLGWGVTFLDRIEPSFFDPGAGDGSDDVFARHVDAFARLVDDWGLRDDTYLERCGGRSVGLSREQAIARISQSDVLLNVMGFLTDEEMIGAARRRVFLDIDPGFGQCWSALGQADLLDGHHVFATVGGNIGTDRCMLPACGRQWLPILPPVVLDQWPVVPHGTSFTSVVSWRGPFGPIEVDGRRLGLRVHEFRRFARLPRLTTPLFELVLDIDPEDGADRALLLDGGWSIADPSTVAEPHAYRSYVQRSRAEICVAKEIYVRSACGWFSDRSACYLASGKPVIAQDTGFSDLLPVGEGLLAFHDPDGAAAAIEEVDRNYELHSRAARALAEEYFDSDRVIGHVLERLEVA